MCASEALSSAGEQRWNLVMAAAVEVVAHPRLAAAGPPPATAMSDPIVAPAWACNISL